ncbi:MAG TPA: tRNA 2-selenouridine(34) synthase MnmH [Burkholderiales bacterium]
METPERKRAVTVAQLAGFDEIIDARSPSEYAEDHVPGAVNCPVLDDAERARIGTLYKQVSPFDAKKVGAALVARNIARHIEERFRERPRDWRPLIYCWRGGKRSGAMAHILSQIGWEARTLEGGYRAYRRAVIEELETLPARFRWRVVCGLTGTGKSRMLAALAERGAQVLDLEELAAHRGSVLGNLPDRPQPSQKMLESRIWGSLRRLDPARPVYAEAESKKIGLLRLPDALLCAMWAGEVIRLEMDVPGRVALLMEEYGHFLASPQQLQEKLDLLHRLYGATVIGRWKGLAAEGAWNELVAELLQTHYDPAYLRSTRSHYPRYDQGLVMQATSGSREEFLILANRAMGSEPG